MVLVSVVCSVSANGSVCDTACDEADSASIGEPHSAQKRAPSGRSVPHEVQRDVFALGFTWVRSSADVTLATGVPQRGQKASAAVRDLPHDAQSGMLALLVAGYSESSVLGETVNRKHSDHAVSWNTPAAVESRLLGVRPCRIC